MEAVKLYNQEATQFTVRFFIAPDATVNGQLVLELADFFLANLVFPGCRPTSLWTKTPGMDSKPSIGEFSEKRWSTAAKRLAANGLALVRLEAQTRDFPDQKIDLYVHGNPPGGDERVQGAIEVTRSVPYLRHLAASSETIEALIEFGRTAWNGATPCCGFGNLAILPKRPGVTPFAMGGPPKLGPVAPPADRPHAIPIAYTGNDIDGNIDSLICAGRGIKGAFWATYLGARHVEMAAAKRS